MIDSIKQLLQQEAQAVLNIPVTDAYEKAVKLIVEQIHQKKGKLVTSGMGKAGQIAMNIANAFFFIVISPSLLRFVLRSFIKCLNFIILFWKDSIKFPI